MIVGDLDNWPKEQQAYTKTLAKGIEYLRRTDFSGMGPGKYEIEGELMYALVQEMHTEAKELRKPEAHDRFVDIQYLISGIGERIGVSRRQSDAVPSEDYLCSRDVAFFTEVKDEVDLILRPGMFAVFFPDDVHRPCCAVDDAGGSIKKVVIKINRTLL